MSYLTVEQIIAKVSRGEPLTPWERSVYRLNVRPDGSRYSSDEETRQRQYDEDNASASARFVKAAQDVTLSHGGRPTASLENGKIVFTYPDGTRTCGGQRVN